VSGAWQQGSKVQGQPTLNLERFVKIHPYFEKIVIAIHKNNDKFATI
jgi:hypothetical protein